MKVLINLLFVSFFTTGFGQFWSPTGANTSAGASYMLAAASIGDNIYAVGNNAVFVHSSDRGVNWTIPTITPPPGTYVYLTGCGNYLYVSMKINTYDYELHFSVDNGTTWTRDTVGLPNNLVNSGKASMNVRDMGQGYVMAFDNSNAVFKQLGTTNWISTTIDFVIIDVIAMNDNWYAIGSNKILKSADHGGSWNEISTVGLPSGFQGYKLASNGTNRLFMSNAPAAGGEDIYLSTDDGNSWSLTNSSGHYSHSNPYLGFMYAVDEYIFASISPEQFNFNDPPPFLMSSAALPNFNVGDTSGLPNGVTTGALPLYFHSGNKLFTMIWDIYVSEPGFVGNPVNEIPELNQLEVTVFPNPANEEIFFTYPDFMAFETISLYSVHGELVKTIDGSATSLNVSEAPRGCYFLKFKSTSGVITKKLMLD